VRDFAQVKFKSVTGFSIDKKTASEALSLFEIDELGLDSMDRKLLAAMIEKFDGGPVGIETLSSVLSEERDTIEDVYEPYLVQQGFIQRTPRGRVATPLAFSHLGFPPKTLF
jgi:Holliday junction DNA helicase RuvB